MAVLNTFLVRSAVRLLGVTTLVIIAIAGTTVPAQATYIVTATETGGDVVFDGLGSLNVGAWRAPVSPTNRIGGIQPSGTDVGLLLGSNSSVQVGDYLFGSNFSGPSSFGTGSLFTRASSGVGDYVGINPVFTALFVPFGYTSGDPLSGSTTFSEQTFSTLGLTPDVYEWTWGDGVTADSFILRIVGATSVPEPGTLALLGIGLLGMSLARRRKG